MIRVLFVCLGTVCRSPSAEGVFRHAVAAAGLAGEIEIDSAGTGGHFAGRAPDPRAVAAAARRGIRIAGSARQVRPDDLERFDHVLAMDAENLDYLERLGRERGPTGARLALFLGDRSVPDPFYGGDDGFERVLDLLAEGSAELLARLRTELRA